MDNNRLTIKINEKDNVAVAIMDLEKGTDIGSGIVTRDFIPQAHKIALKTKKRGLRKAAG